MTPASRSLTLSGCANSLRALGVSAAVYGTASAFIFLGSTWAGPGCDSCDLTLSGCANSLRALGVSAAVYGTASVFFLPHGPHPGTPKSTEGRSMMQCASMPPARRPRRANTVSSCSRCSRSRMNNGRADSSGTVTNRTTASRSVGVNVNRSHCPGPTCHILAHDTQRSAGNGA